MKLPRIIALAVIAHLVATPVTSGILVLCFGSDGHVAVESANSGLCCREWVASHQGDPDFVESLELASRPCCDDVELSIVAAALTVPVQKVIATSTIPPRQRRPALLAQRRRGRRRIQIWRVRR